MYGEQNNDILGLRTKLEWLLPPVIQADKLVDGASQVYLNRDKFKNYQGHKWPTIGDRRHKKTYGTSKVVDRPFRDLFAFLVLICEHVVIVTDII